MKKCFSVLLVLLLAISICGCKKEVKKPESSEYISEINYYIDKSYNGDNYLLYAIYTVTAKDRDIEFFYYTQSSGSVGSGATLTLNGINVYSDMYCGNASLSKPFEITELKNPGEGQLIEKGGSLRLISAFYVSKSDIESLSHILLTLTATDKFNECEKLDKKAVEYIDSAYTLAREISPDGLTSEEKALAEEIEELDSSTLKEIEEALTGSWEYTKEDIKYNMTFEKGKYTETQKVGNKKAKTTASGSYSVRKKVILITLKDKTQLRIPYTYINKVLTVSPPKATE